MNWTRGVKNALVFFYLFARVHQIVGIRMSLFVVYCSFFPLSTACFAFAPKMFALRSRFCHKTSREHAVLGVHVLQGGTAHFQTWLTTEHISKFGWVPLDELPGRHSRKERKKKPLQNIMSFHAYAWAAITSGLFKHSDNTSVQNTLRTTTEFFSSGNGTLCCFLNF